MNLWGEASRLSDQSRFQSPVRKRDSVRRQYAKCFFLMEVRGEGNCGRVTDRGKEACECSIAVASGSVHAKTCEATNRNAIEAQRDPEVSCPWTAKPFPTDSGVDDELVQRKFTFLSGEICATYLGVGLARKPEPRAPTAGWSANATRCGAEVSISRSTADRSPTIAGRASRL